MDLGLKNAGPCKVLGEGAAFLLVNAGVWSKRGGVRKEYHCTLVNLEKGPFKPRGVLRCKVARRHLNHIYRTQLRCDVIYMLLR